MEKGYYGNEINSSQKKEKSQSTIKMEKGYYLQTVVQLHFELSGRNPQ